ncbi:MAG TPA: carbon-nitrogen hydrolase family protein [Polyangia bacterium]|nr:carbon-nitrogen hydrolase family protein [Polyangia bacterium]
MMTRLGVGVVQITSRENVAANLARCEGAIAEAAGRGARLLALPENFAFLGLHERDKFKVAEVLDDAQPGPILGALKAAAQKNRCWVVGGGMPEQTREPEKVYNTCVVVDEAGRLAATYRKIHLFDVDIPHGAQFRESDSVVPGQRPVVVETPWGRLGLSVCYDLRFPELYRALAQEGARMIVVPSAFTLHTGKDHWHALLRARAIENQCFLIAPAQFGRHNEKRTTYGHSVIVDPWGTVLAEMGDREGVAVAELDFDFLEKTRREMPCLTHRRL